MLLPGARRTRKLESGAGAHNKDNQENQDNVEDLENWAQQSDVVASGYLVASVASTASIRSAMRLILACVKLIPVGCAPPRGSDVMQNFIRFLHAN